MNPEDQQSQADTRLSDEALEWIVRLHSGRAGAADRDAFAAWRGQSAGHEHAAREAEAIWSGIGLAGDEVRRTERRAARVRVTRRAVLGGVAVAAAGTALHATGMLGPHLLADHVTGIGEQRTVALADGSTVFLNAGSALSVDFGESVRRLRLHRGQATFTVASDAARPFVVAAADGSARALGTVFDVDIRPLEVVVTVIEGTVGVTAGPSGDAILAGVNQRVRYGAAGAPLPAEAVDADTETAWRRGKLIFDRRPLGDVVAEIERYRRGRIVIASDRLRRLEVTGVFDLADPDAILDVMEETLPVRVARLPFLTVVR